MFHFCSLCVFHPCLFTFIFLLFVQVKSGCQSLFKCLCFLFYFDASLSCIYFHIYSFHIFGFASNVSLCLICSCCVLFSTTIFTCPNHPPVYILPQSPRFNNNPYFSPSVPQCHYILLTLSFSSLVFTFLCIVVFFICENLSSANSGKRSGFNQLFLAI